MASSALSFIGVTLIITLNDTNPSVLQGCVAAVDTENLSLTLSNVLLESGQIVPEIHIPAHRIKDIQQISPVPAPTTSTPSNTVNASLENDVVPKTASYTNHSSAERSDPSALQNTSLYSLNLNESNASSTSINKIRLLKKQQNIDTSQSILPSTFDSSANYESFNNTTTFRKFHQTTAGNNRRKNEPKETLDTPKSEAESNNSRFNFSNIKLQCLDSSVSTSASSKYYGRSNLSFTNGAKHEGSGAGSPICSFNVQSSNSNLANFTTLQENSNILDLPIRTANNQDVNMQKSRRVRKNGNRADWVRASAKGIANGVDFDFETNLSKFNKDEVFRQIRACDKTSDEDRLININRSRPGTNGGRNLHFSESVLDTRSSTSRCNSFSDTFKNSLASSGIKAPSLAAAGILRQPKPLGRVEPSISASVYDGCNDRANLFNKFEGNSSTVPLSQPSLKLPKFTDPLFAFTKPQNTKILLAPQPQAGNLPRKIADTISPYSNERNEALDQGKTTEFSSQVTNVLTKITEATQCRLINARSSDNSGEKRKGCFVITETKSICPTVTPLELAGIEEKACLELGLSNDIIVENTGRGIAEILLQTINPGGSRLDEGTLRLNGGPICVFLVGNHRTGSRAIAAARHIAERGCKPVVCILGLENKFGHGEGQVHQTNMNEDFQAPFILHKELERQIDMFVRRGGLVLSWRETAQFVIQPQHPTEMIIDALLAPDQMLTQLDPLTKNTALLMLDWAFSCRLPMIALEAPSGVDHTTGNVSSIELNKSIEIHIKGVGKGSNLTTIDRLESSIKHVVCLGAPCTGLLNVVQDNPVLGRSWRFWGVDGGYNRALTLSCKGDKERQGPGRQMRFGASWVVSLSFRSESGTI